MNWILGFGIPVVYLALGLFSSRAAFRSRHKRGLNGYLDEMDTHFLCTFMALGWPALAPIYFPIVWWGKDSKTAIERFYKHNLPETNAEAQRRRDLEAHNARVEKKHMEDYIDRLEQELKVGPYKKEIG